ncbi:MAG: Hsp20/alpha crystallin family protein, partial [Candidatus Marinimicrobia bacterium]|nr:Hsp20/alpha crystallin family protein [Candidatus Neomarinimicrobiota bacterium]
TNGVSRFYNSLLDDFFSDPFFSAERSEPVHWVPRVEVEENEDEYVMHLEVPGMKKNDIDISVKDNVITISGEKKERVHKKDSQCHLNEICYGKFSRSFQLPNNVDTEKIKGNWESGILSIEIPKTEVAKPRKIEIS